MKKILLSLSSFAALITIGLVVSCAPSTTTPATQAHTQSSHPGLDYQNSKADIIVLSFFDMYCPKCQRDAKYVNRIHATTRQRGLGSKVQFYAIGWNNSPLESDMYRKRFNVTYPVIPDKNRSISSRFGKIKPPMLVVLKKQNGQWQESARYKNVRSQSAEILSQLQP